MSQQFTLSSSDLASSYHPPLKVRSHSLLIPVWTLALPTGKYGKWSHQAISKLSSIFYIYCWQTIFYVASALHVCEPSLSVLPELQEAEISFSDLKKKKKNPQNIARTSWVIVSNSNISGSVHTKKGMLHPRKKEKKIMYQKMNLNNESLEKSPKVPFCLPKQIWIRLSPCRSQVNMDISAN